MDYGTIKHKNNNTQLLSQSILHQYEGGGQRSLNTILDNIYPIGSIYLSIYNTNPSEYFGGTWEQVAGGTGTAQKQPQPSPSDQPFLREDHLCRLR